MSKIKMIKSRIKLKLAYPNYQKVLLQLRQTSKRKWLIMGSPIHDNLGDHLITLSELDYLHSFSLDVEIFEIPTEMVILYSQIIKDCLTPNDIIFVNGGGWMGTLWKHDEFFMQHILHTFKSNKIIVFPQTVYYDDSDTEQNQVLNNAKDAWRSAPKAILCLRDEASYQYALNEIGLESERCLFLPDVALLYKTEIPPVQKERKILLCLRNDKEQVLPLAVRGEIENFIKNNNYCYAYTSTLTRKVVSINERRALVNKKIKEFASAQIIITDRLHGMIFAFLANTPCIAIDNRTRKVFGVYNAWLNEVNTIQSSLPQTDELKSALVNMFAADEAVTKAVHLDLKNKYDILERFIIDEH